MQLQASNGTYILPLDADDKIGSSYIEDAVNILNKNSNIGMFIARGFFSERAI